MVNTTLASRASDLNRVASTYGDDTVSMAHTPGVTNVCDRGWQLEGEVSFDLRNAPSPMYMTEVSRSREVNSAC